MATNTKRALGKGLGAIITSSPSPATEVEKVVVEQGGGERVLEIEIDHIEPNPDQPRLHFDQQEIDNLAESIRSVGLIQPIIVRRDKTIYRIVAGERRYRASKSLGLKTIRAIVIEADEEKNLTVALIENVQRQNLDPIEEARAYRLLIERFKLKQNDVAARVGKDRATIANSLRLLNLPHNMQDAVSSGALSVGHAKVLLPLKGEELDHYYRIALDKGISVRALERAIEENRIQTSAVAPKPGSKADKVFKDAHLKKMEDKLTSLLGTRVEIRHSKGKGKIEISYYSLDDFERIMEKFE